MIVISGSENRDLVDPDTGTPDAYSAACSVACSAAFQLTVASCHLGGSRSFYSSKLLLEQQGALSHLFFGDHLTIPFPGFCYVTVIGDGFSSLNSSTPTYQIKPSGQLKFDLYPSKNDNWLIFRSHIGPTR